LNRELYSVAMIKYSLYSLNERIKLTMTFLI